MRNPNDMKPPRLANQLLEWYCRNVSAEDMYGDLEELFNTNMQTMPLWKARLVHWRHVFSLIFSYAVRSRKRKSVYHPYSHTPISLAMILNYFKIAWRTITRNPVYSTINVLGLAFGICTCLIIYLVSSHEFSFDRFHADGDQIFRLEVQSGTANEKQLCICTPPPTAAAIREEITGIESVAGFIHYDPKISIPDGGKQAKNFDRQTASVVLAGPEYFDVFSYTWLAGSPALLKEPFKVVLSESRARTYFGSLSLDEIVGREIIYDDSLHVSVAAIVKDWTQNTDFHVTEWISLPTIEATFLKQNIAMDDWHWLRHSSQTFVKLKSGVSRTQTAVFLTAMIRKHTGDNKTPGIEFLLQPLATIHFNNNDHEPSTLLRNLYALIGLASFILIIAAINFVNLSTAQSLRRAREIGIRKTLGGFRKNIIVQFLVETFVVTLFAAALALFVTKPALILLDGFIPHGVSFDILSPTVWIFILSIVLLTSLLAGFYPAKVISAHLPAINLKGPGAHRGSNNWYLRKGLIVFQFTISLFFIISTLVMSQQLRFIRTKDRGFATDAVVIFRTSWNDKTPRTKILVNEIKRLPGITGVALQSIPPMGFAKMMNTLSYRGDSLVETGVSIKAGNADFIPLYRIRLLAGRNIADSDSLKELVINDHYRKILGIKRVEEALGQFLYFMDKPYPIVGVVEDFHEQSFHEVIGPVVIGNWNELEHSIAIKLAVGANTQDVLSHVEKEFKTFFPDEPFSYHFIEEEIQRMHDAEQKTESLMNLAMIITIFISCIGIFGLSMFQAEVRTKEIGVRKVLGASVANITSTLTREFVVLILLAIAVASPIAWYYMSDWLSRFSYRVDLSIGVFFGAGAIAVILGLVTLSYHTIKAALANPVKSLRTE